MNTNQFARLLAVEAVNLYQHKKTPEKFLKKIIPLLVALEDNLSPRNRSKEDLEEILISSKPKPENQASNTDCYYDVVDLAMYRAN